MPGHQHTTANDLPPVALMPDTASPNEALLEEAADWCLRLHDPTCSDTDRAAFKEWLGRSEQHAAEYAQMAEIWGLSELLPAAQPAAASSTDALKGSPARPSARRQSSRSRALARAAVQALLVLPACAMLGWTAGWLPNHWNSYESLASMQRLTLRDGSEVDLNMGSHLTFANYKDRRQVALDEGEAYFHVSHDSNHPFVVNVDGGSVTVTGTRFNVWKYQDQVVVTVTEGSVRVRSDNSTEDSHLTAGMQASYRSGDTHPTVQGTINDNALAWRNGKLILNEMRLADALPLINRYLPHPLGLADKSSADLRIGGVYSTSDIQGLVKALPQVLPVDLLAQADGSTLIKAHAAR